MSIVRNSRATIYSASHATKCPVNKSWMIDKCERDPVANLWRITLRDLNGVRHEAALDRLVSWPIVQVAIFRATRGWPVGHSRQSWRQALADFFRPTRPTKKSDSRCKGFDGESVEVDAIAPSDLRDIARDCIEQHVDEDALRRTRLVEDAERDTLATWIDTMSGGAAT